MLSSALRKKGRADLSGGRKRLGGCHAIHWSEGRIESMTVGFFGQQAWWCRLPPPELTPRRMDCPGGVRESVHAPGPSLPAGPVAIEVFEWRRRPHDRGRTRNRFLHAARTLSPAGGRAMTGKPKAMARARRCRSLDAKGMTKTWAPCTNCAGLAIQAPSKRTCDPAPAGNQTPNTAAFRVNRQAPATVSRHTGAAGGDAFQQQIQSLTGVRLPTNSSSRDRATAAFKNRPPRAIARRLRLGAPARASLEITLGRVPCEAAGNRSRPSCGVARSIQP